MEIIGREIELGVATEASRGTPETAADTWGRKVTANVVERAVHAVDDTTRGRLEDGEGRRKVQSYVEGEVTGIVHADFLGYLLSNLYGRVSTATISGSVKAHTFTLRQNIQHQSLTLFAKDGDVQQLAFGNVMINTLEINVALEEYVRYTANFIGATATDDDEVPSYATEYDFVARDVVIKVADTEGGLAGATALKAKTIDLTFDKGLIRDHVVGGYAPDDIYNGHFMLEGTFTKNFDDETFKDLYLGDAAKYMSITIEGEADIGAGNHPKLALVLNKVQIMDWNRQGDSNALVEETVNFRAFFNASDAEMSSVILQNLTASYANVPSS